MEHQPIFSLTLRMFLLLAVPCWSLLGHDSGSFHSPSDRDSKSSVLFLKPFTPTVPSLFPSKAYGAAPADHRLLTNPDQVREQLEEALSAVVKSGRLGRAQIEAIHDAWNDPERQSSLTKRDGAKIDDRLLAATLLLSGTSAGPALPVLLQGQNPTGVPARILWTNMPAGLAKTTVVTNEESAEATWIIALNGTPENPRMRAEPLQAIASTIAHEAMHQDQAQSQIEEVAAKWLETVVWAEFLLTTPGLAEIETPVVRTLNLQLLLFLNSGGNWPCPGLKRAKQEIPSAAPGSSSINCPSYERFLRTQLYEGLPDITTPGNTYLVALFPKFTDGQFTAELLDHLDALQPFTNSEIERLVAILKVAPSEPR